MTNRPDSQTPTSLPSSNLARIHRSLGALCHPLAALVALIALAPTSVFAQSLPPKGSPDTFDIATWNIEWFGAALGPSNDELQFNNVLKVIRSADIDLWALQEVSDPDDFQRLLDSLGTGYDGYLATYSQQQKTAFLFKTDVITVRSVKHVLESFEDDFAGRPPLELEATVAADPNRTVTLITVHMKANSELASYEKRLAAAGRLKNHVDFTSLNSEMVILLGDFNDLLIGSITSGQVSPYKAFTDDGADYLFATEDLARDGRSTYCGNNCASGSAIDHILMTNELFGPYIDASVDNYDEVLAAIPGYLSNTSDHLPVFARFELDTQSAVENDEPHSGAVVSLYPNPASGFVNVAVTATTPQRFEAAAFDLLGREVFTWNVTGNESASSISLDLSGVAPGVYLVRVSWDGGSDVRVLTVTR